MEFLSKRRGHYEKNLPDEDYDDGMTGEVVDSGYSDNGRSIWYKLRMPDGSTREYAIPTKPLGVRFTINGPIELDEDH